MGAESSTMQNSAANATSACSGCKNLGNRYTDTVKVDLENINPVPAAAASGDNKENSDPRPAQMLEKVAASKRLAEQEKALKQEEEAKQQRRAEEEQRREREQQLEAKRRKQAEEEERLAALKAKEEEEARRIQEEQLARAAEEEQRQARQRQEEEERKRKIQQEEEARRLQKEQEEAAEERRRREEEEAAKQEQLRSFLEKAGFNSATEKKVKKGMMKMSSSFSYPLHAAVEQKDAEAVQALLWAGADPSQANSKKQTPFQLAQAKNNKQGSHAKVMAALAA